MTKVVFYDNIITVKKYPATEELLICSGKYFTVEWYYEINGNIPAKSYYELLSETEQDRLDDMIRYLADSPFGTRLPKTMYNIEDHENKIYAFKPKNERFFNFFTENKKIIITNAYRKHSQKMTKQDLELLEIAIKYKKEYIQRLKERTYYEK